MEHINVVLRMRIHTSLTPCPYVFIIFLSFFLSFFPPSFLFLFSFLPFVHLFFLFSVCFGHASIFLLATMFSVKIILGNQISSFHFVLEMKNASH